MGGCCGGPMAPMPEQKEVSIEKIAAEEKAPEEEQGENEAPLVNGEPSQQTALVSTKTADPIEFDLDKLERTEEPEVYGLTPEAWFDLFQAMKENAEEAGKEVNIRISRTDPEESLANKFYMCGQIFS